MSAAEDITFVVPEGIHELRGDKILAEHFKEWSRSQIQGIFDKGEVTLNGKAIKKNFKVSAGAALVFKPPAELSNDVKAVDIPLDIHYEDDDVIVVNKAAGMVVHPGSNTGEDTLVHALLHHTGGKLSAAGEDNRPGVVHRLDKDTSGLIIFAKTDVAYHHLVAAFSEREVHKEYLALVVRAPRLDSGTIKKNIERHPVNRRKMHVAEEGSGRFAHTDWKVEERFGTAYALLRCRIHTGRTHQIRVHLSDMKHIIFGDATYGYRPGQKYNGPLPERVFLHSERLSVKHPTEDRELQFTAPLTDDITAQLQLFRDEFGSNAKA